MLQKVKQQYENYPYPKRDPEDEKSRITLTSCDSLDLINFYCFEGKRNFYNSNFRVLVAGGGTGDGAIYLGEQLRNSDAEITYVDISEASLKIARERAKIRDLKNIRFILGSLLSCPELDGEKFDYINCIGVLHHLKDPAEGLKSLRSMLKDDGAMGLMVYAKYGRTGVYEMQEIMRLINKDEENMQVKVENTKNLIPQLPETCLFKKHYKNYSYDIENFGDIGIYDLLLHSQDRCYTVPELYEWLENCGMHLTVFLGHNVKGRISYNPLNYIKDKGLREKVKKLSRMEKHALAELMNGSIKKHTFYTTPKIRNMPSVEDKDNIPYFSSFLQMKNLQEQIESTPISAKEIHILKIKQDTDEMNFPVLPLTKYIFRYLDGKKTINDLITTAENDTEYQQNKKLHNLSDSTMYEEFKRTYMYFNSCSWILLKDKSVPSYNYTSQDLQSYMNSKYGFLQEGQDKANVDLAFT